MINIFQNITMNTMIKNINNTEAGISNMSLHNFQNIILETGASIIQFCKNPNRFIIVRPPWFCKSESSLYTVLNVKTGEPLSFYQDSWMFNIKVSDEGFDDDRFH